MQASLLIDNEWQTGKGETFASLQPVTGQVLWQENAAAHEDVLRAVAAAERASATWMLSSMDERVELVKRFERILSSHKEAMTLTIAKETGKPLWEAATEVTAMISKVAISIKSFEQRTPNTEVAQGGITSAVRHKPHGVVAVFGPYNFPGHLPNGHIIPALLAGNTIVFKPSEFTPLVAEQMMQYWLQADLPKGVINLVQGGKETGQSLAGAKINGLFFTGSYNTGRLLHQQYAGDTARLLALEMGGNNPLIAFDINDVDAAVVNIIQSAFMTAGQRCTCARRLIVADNTEGEAIIERLLAVTQTLLIGNYDAEPSPFMGPVISKNAAEQLLNKQASLQQLGGQSLVPLQPINNINTLLRPGIIDVTGIHDEDEEIFGPLLKVVRVNHFEAAIEQANQTNFGLSAGLLSQNGEHYRQFYAKAKAGIINWNRPTTGASSAAPFGGIGQSGNHRPSAFYAADYCAYPVASMEAEKLQLAESLPPGLIV